RVGRRRGRPRAGRALPRPRAAPLRAGDAPARPRLGPHAGERGRGRPPRALRARRRLLAGARGGAPRSGGRGRGVQPRALARRVGALPLPRAARGGPARGGSPPRARDVVPRRAGHGPRAGAGRRALPRAARAGPGAARLAAGAARRAVPPLLRRRGRGRLPPRHGRRPGRAGRPRALPRRRALGDGTISGGRAVARLAHGRARGRAPGPHAGRRGDRPLAPGVGAAGPRALRAGAYPICVTLTSMEPLKPDRSRRTCQVLAKSLARMVSLFSVPSRVDAMVVGFPEGSTMVTAASPAARVMLASMQSQPALGTWKSCAKGAEAESNERLRRKTGVSGDPSGGAPVVGFAGLVGGTPPLASWPGAGAAGDEAQPASAMAATRRARRGVGRMPADDG